MITTHRINALALAAALAAALVPADVGLGESRAQDQDATEPEREITFSLPSGYELRFDTDIDGGGTIGVSRFHFGLDAETELDQDLNLKLSFRYALDQYDFTGATRLGGVRPWEDIHTLGFAALFRWTVRNDWFISSGPVVQFSRETGADWDDSLIGGAVVSATHVFNDRLMVGGGFGIVSQIEDDARVVPIIVLNWQLKEKLRLSTLGGAGASGGTSLELIYDLGHGWEAALGGRYDFRRFRLDNTGVAPGGVGEETSLPFWVRLSHRINENFSVDMYGGLTAGGSLELEDRNGTGIGSENFDPAGFLGLAVKIGF
ncbi:MAG: hypothetical protein O6768_05005 [Planctomycetota bacterium]|nr:hypothetical protein [Planctomycetota bacterium]